MREGTGSDFFESLPVSPFILTAVNGSSAFIEAHFFPNLPETFYNKVNVFFCMAGTYLSADSCLSLWHNGEGEGNDIDTLCHHSFCKFSGQFFIVEHDRHAGMGSRNDIKSIVGQLFSVICGGFLQMIAQLCTLLQHIKQLQAGADDRGSQGIGEQVWTASLAQEINDFSASGGVSARRSAKSLAKR